MLLPSLLELSKYSVTSFCDDMRLSSLISFVFIVDHCLLPLRTRTVLFHLLLSSIHILSHFTEISPFFQTSRAFPLHFLPWECFCVWLHHFSPQAIPWRASCCALSVSGSASLSNLGLMQSQAVLPGNVTIWILMNLVTQEY